MKKLKCIKCKIYFKDRNDPEEYGVNKELCLHCKVIWKMIGLTLTAISNNSNRIVEININDVYITKRTINDIKKMHTIK